MLLWLCVNVQQQKTVMRDMNKSVSLIKQENLVKMCELTSHWFSLHIGLH